VRPLRYDPFQKPEFVEFLESQDGAPFRIYGLDRLVHPNTATAYGLQDVRGYTATTVSRYIEYVRSFIDEDAGFRFTGRWPIFQNGEGDQLVENPFFDLMNVRYVLSPRVLPVASDYDLAQKFALSEPSGIGEHRLDGFEINGAPEAVLFQAPPVESSYSFTPTEDSRFLLFRIGMDPLVWTSERGDGATFVVQVRASGSEDTLFSQYIDPKNEPGDRRWHDGSVDLTAYLGVPITVVLSTTFGENGLWDWAGWGGLRLGPDENTPVRSSSQYRLVHQDDAVRVYENLDALPRAFLVNDIRTVESMERALGELSDTSFNPAQTAVIEGSPPTDVLSMLDAGASTGASEVLFQEYSDNNVRLRVRTDEPALLVLTDTYYPGWKVTVDGDRGTIYPADVAFRGVFIPAGEHVVEFSYSPATFKAGAAISLASIAVLISYAAFAAVRHRLRPRTRTVSDDGTPSSDSPPFDGQEPDE
jgi:hypothetical protein